jgi:hypothetical protein
MFNLATAPRAMTSRVHLAYLTLLLGLSWVFGPGCGGGGNPPEPLAAEEVPAAVTEAFQTGPEEIRETAESVASALQANDDPRAFLQLQELIGNPELTHDQRDTATRSLMAISARLAAAAEQGNAAAQQVLEAHRAHK